MKKVLAVLLSALLLACVLPIGAVAADAYIFPASASFTASNDLASGTNYFIPDGVTMTVPSGVTLFIPADSKLTVEQGGKLIVDGAIDVQKGAELIVQGTVINSDNVTGEGSAIAELRFAAHDAVCSCGNAETCDKLKIYLGSEDITGAKVNYVPVIPGEVKAVELNSQAYVKVEITEPDAKYNMYDEKYIHVYFNGVTVAGVDGVHQTKVSTGSDVTFTKFDGGQAFYTDCTVTIKGGEGYDIVSSNGYTSKDETFVVKFGTPVAVRVDIDEDYDQSHYEVYIYNGVGFVNGSYELDGEQIADDNGNPLFISGINPAQPDEFGYYGFVPKGNSTVHVIGVIANEKLETMGDILSVIRSVFDMIRNLVSQLLAVFGITL